MASTGEQRGVELRINPAVSLHWRDWGGDSVVFEERSGDILLIDPLGAAVMALLESGTTRVDDLVATIAADLQTEPGTEIVDAVQAALDHFLRLGWLESVDAWPVPACR